MEANTRFGNWIFDLIFILFRVHVLKMIANARAGKNEVIAHVIALGFCPSMHVGRLADVRALKHSNYAWTNDDAFAGARSMFYLCSVPVFRCGLLRLCVVTMILKCIACSANTPKSETHIHFYICI